MDQGTVAGLYVTDAPLKDVTARLHDLGGRDGCHVYLSFYQTMPHDLMSGSEEDKERFDTLYAALEALTADALTFTVAPEGGPSRYTSRLYGISLDLPAAWVGQVEVREYLGLPEFYMKDAGDWGGKLLSVTWTSSAEYDEESAPTPVYFLAEQDGITLYAYPATDVQFDPERDQERYRALEQEIPALLDSLQVDESVVWPKLTGWGLLTGADADGVTVDLLEQQSWYQFTNLQVDETRMAVAPDAVAGVESPIQGANSEQITYEQLLNRLDEVRGQVFQLYTVDGVLVGLSQQGAAEVTGAFDARIHPVTGARPAPTTA